VSVEVWKKGILAIMVATRPASGIHELLVNARHLVSASATMTPLDALLAERAWCAMDFLRGNPGSVGFAAVL
jgi:hypothetical protein